MTRYKITAKMVIEFHDLLGPDLEAQGIRERGTLDYLVERINEEEDVFRRAAWALYLAEQHPFWDGQKRTAFYLTDMILRVEGYYIHEEQDKIISVLTKIARYECTGNIEEIENWLRKKSRRHSKSEQLHLR